MLKIFANGNAFELDIPRGDNPISGDGKILGKSKVKTLAPVDLERVNTVKEFVDMAATEARLEWALDNLVREQLKPLEMKSMGDFIRTVFNDICKEEGDTMVANNLTQKDLGGAVANISRPWFIAKVNSGVGL